MCAAQLGALGSRALQYLSDTCMQQRPSQAKPDSAEKLYPDKRSLIIHKKENELDPNTQSEKLSFVVEKPLIIAAQVSLPAS